MEIIFISTLMEMALVVLALAILFVATQLLRHRKTKTFIAKRRSLDVEARAIVLALEQTGLFLNHRPQVKMQMQVLPERGRNFVAEVKEVITFMELATIRIGSTVTVKYNPTNNKDVVLVTNSFNHKLDQAIR